MDLPIPNSDSVAVADRTGATYADEHNVESWDAATNGSDHKKMTVKALILSKEVGGLIGKGMRVWGQRLVEPFIMTVTEAEARTLVTFNR